MDGRVSCLKKKSILLFCSNEQHTDYKSARAVGIKRGTITKQRIGSKI